MSEQKKPEALNEHALDDAVGGFTGGVRVAAGDLDGDGVSSTAPQPKPKPSSGGGPRVAVFDGRS